jgi:hypothetical protein
MYNVWAAETTSVYTRCIVAVVLFYCNTNEGAIDTGIKTNNSIISRDLRHCILCRVVVSFIDAGKHRVYWFSFDLSIAYMLTNGSYGQMLKQIEYKDLARNFQGAIKAGKHWRVKWRTRLRNRKLNPHYRPPHVVAELFDDAVSGYRGAFELEFDFTSFHSTDSSTIATTASAMVRTREYVYEWPTNPVDGPTDGYFGDC